MTESYVYVKDDQFGWLPANILQLDSKKGRATVRVTDVDGTRTVGNREIDLRDYDGQTLPLRNVDKNGKLLVMPDMVNLPSLHEPAILYNLRARHQNLKPYTRVGDLIVAVNPFKWLTELYSEKTRSLYTSKLICGGGNNSGSEDDGKLASLAPHVYETASLAYRGLAVDGENQSILVSGESGAGKTETVKIVLSHLASIQTDANGSSKNTTESSGSHHTIVQRVLDSNPLLESFGNAKTIRNDNSSRFGKFLQMQFDIPQGTSATAGIVRRITLAGSKCETYLLEKSRVVSHVQPERTYHIFYELLAARDDIKEKLWPEGLVGKTCADYRYVGHTDTKMIDGMSDVERMDSCINALELLDINGDKLKMFMQAVCTVMQLGNLTFEADPSDSEKSIITSPYDLRLLSNLMGIAPEDLTKSLTYRTYKARGDVYKVPLKESQARDACDSFAKEIYQQVFDWLVREINGATCAESNYEKANTVGEYGLIGLLDIFGFESFEVNRFEQLCINYTNEKLQQKYTQDVFRAVQEEYEFEGIELAEIQYVDNIEVLTLLEGHMGVISVLNEECVRPQGNDLAFVNKLKAAGEESGNPALIHEHLHTAQEFGIQHYAGVVTYDATNFTQKNTDILPPDLIGCACNSTNDLINVELKAALERRKLASQNEANKTKSGRALTVTVTSKFREQLHDLMVNISSTKTRYIRCIKPNAEKVPIKMDMGSCEEQLRCAGVVAAVTITRAAFPDRLPHETVLERFGTLTMNRTPQDDSEEKKDDDDCVDYLAATKEEASNLLNDVLKELDTIDEESGKVTKAFAVGKTRIYFRKGALEFLENKRLLMFGQSATIITAFFRGFPVRLAYLKMKRLATRSAANAKRNIARRRFLKIRHASSIIGCWIRCVYAKRDLMLRMRTKAAIKIQRRVREYQVHTIIGIRNSAATAIQRIGRGYNQRYRYRKALFEIEVRTGVQCKLVSLQKKMQLDLFSRWLTADKARATAERRLEEVEKILESNEDERFELLQKRAEQAEARLQELEEKRIEAEKKASRERLDLVKKLEELENRLDESQRKKREAEDARYKAEEKVAALEKAIPKAQPRLSASSSSSRSSTRSSPSPTGNADDEQRSYSTPVKNISISTPATDATSMSSSSLGEDVPLTSVRPPSNKIDENVEQIRKLKKKNILRGRLSFGGSKNKSKAISTSTSYNA